MSAEDQISALRDAVRVSPDNVPLRAHLANVLLHAGYADEAEVEYRAALGQTPNDVLLQIGLAQAFWAQNKTSEASLIVDGLLERAAPVPAALLLAARLSLRDGRGDDAVGYYRRGA